VFQVKTGSLGFELRIPLPKNLSLFSRAENRAGEHLDGLAHFLRKKAVTDLRTRNMQIVSMDHSQRKFSRTDPA
jgi:hypothetical protein